VADRPEPGVLGLALQVGEQDVAIRAAGVEDRLGRLDQLDHELAHAGAQLADVVRNVERLVCLLGHLLGHRCCSSR
jgi:hypothetical protein